MGSGGSSRSASRLSNNVGSTVEFNVPGVSSLTKEIRDLNEELRNFKEAVQLVGSFVRDSGQPMISRYISKITGEYKDLGAAVAGATKTVKTSAKDGGLLLPAGGDYSGLMPSHGSYVGGYQQYVASRQQPAVQAVPQRRPISSLLPPPPAATTTPGVAAVPPPVSSLPPPTTAAGGRAGGGGGVITTLAGGSFDGGGGASRALTGALASRTAAGFVGSGGAAAGGSASAVGGMMAGPAGLAVSVALAAIESAKDLAEDIHKAGILISDVLGPAGTASQSTVRDLAGTLAQNAAVFGPLTEQLAAINIGTQIGAPITKGKLPGSEGTAFLSFLGQLPVLAARAFIDKAASVLRTGEGFVTKTLGKIPGVGGFLSSAASKGFSLLDAPIDLVQVLADKGVKLVGNFINGNAAGRGGQVNTFPDNQEAVRKRTGGFYQAIREMQAITPGVGAGTLAAQFSGLLEDTGAQQRGLIFGQGAFTNFGKGATIKSFSDWAQSILEFFKEKRPGKDRGKDFTYAELVSQNFPGSNINAWFSAMGVPQTMAFYWWQYAMARATKAESSDSPWKPGETADLGRGTDLAGARLRSLTAEGRISFQQVFNSFAGLLQYEESRKDRSEAQNTLYNWAGTALRVSGLDQVVGALGGIGAFSGAIPLITGKASGGAVYKGVPHMVGELGKEMFVPNVNGQVVSTQKIAELMQVMGSPDTGNGGMGDGASNRGPTYNFYATFKIESGGGSSGIEARRIATQTMYHLDNEMQRRVQRRIG